MKAKITVQQYLSLQEENQALKAQLSEIREDFAALQSQLNWLKNQLFGQKSERTEYVLPVGEQLPLSKDDVPKDKPEGSYCVRAGLGFKLKDDRAYYVPGEHVEAVFVFVATDTSYDVKVDAPDVKVEYGSVIKVSFTMPDHDVDISLGFRSVMMNRPFTPMSGVGMMGMVDNVNNGNKPDRANVTDKLVVSDGSEWTCPLCGGKNTGKFCCECGGARPQRQA